MHSTGWKNKVAKQCKPPFIKLLANNIKQCDSISFKQLVNLNGEADRVSQSRPLL